MKFHENYPPLRNEELVAPLPRNVSVRPHQVSQRVWTFDALLRNNLYRSFIYALRIFI